MTAALEGGEWSAARRGLTLPPGKTRYPFYRRLGGPQGRSGRAENLVPTGIRSRTVQPVVSHYTDWATGPTDNIVIYLFKLINLREFGNLSTTQFSTLFTALPICLNWVYFICGCLLLMQRVPWLVCGPSSSVGLATELLAGRSGIESRWRREFPPVQTGPGGHPASCKMGTGSFPGVKCGRGVLLTTHPFLVLRSWKSRAIPLPTLWATPGL